MRLRQLYLRNFKNLRDFHLDFADGLTTVLVGRNGTGKSNVLEALIMIFRDLDLGVTPSIAYSLTYECDGASIAIDADPDRSARTIDIRVDGERWSSDRFSRRGEGTFLPGFVFGYYSGPSNRMQQHFEAHQTRFANELLSGENRPLRPLLYARQVHSQFVLLSFFATSPAILAERSEVLSRFLRIDSLDSVLFVLKRPPWYNRSRAVDPDNPPDDRFWGARGVVRDFLARIYEIAVAPIRRTKPQDSLFLYLPDIDSLHRLAQGYDGQAEFFKALESLYISDLIEDVRTRVRMTDEAGVLTFRELSEGEQQLLTVMGLLRFIEGSQGLILLDEPDTHLNPSWSLEYTSLLREHVADAETAQIVMATHDPLVVSSLVREEVRIMQRQNNGQVTAAMPEEDPQGMGVAGLLTSELYGLRSQLDLATLSLLDKKRDLAAKDDLSKDEKTELELLNRSLDSRDFSRVTRDPLYKPYVDAMSRLELRLGLRKATLTAEEIDRRNGLAEEVVRELLRRIDE